MNHVIHSTLYSLKMAVTQNIDRTTESYLLSSETF